MLPKPYALIMNNSDIVKKVPTMGKKRQRGLAWDLTPTMWGIEKTHKNGDLTVLVSKDFWEGVDSPRCWLVGEVIQTRLTCPRAIKILMA